MRLFIIIIALVFCNYASAKNNDSAAYYLQKGINETQSGHLLQGCQFLDKAYSYNQSDKAILQNLADALFDLRRYPQAKEKYALLAQTGDADAAVYKQLTMLSFNLRQYADVIKYAAQLKKLAPAEKVAFYTGKAQYALENYGEAIKSLEIAAKEAPDNAEVSYMMARIYADMQDLKKAAVYYEKALQLQPDNAGWMYEAALLFYDAGDAKVTLKYLLLAGDKGYLKTNDYLQNLAAAYIQSGYFDKGIAVITEVLQTRPADLGLLNMLARAYYDNKKYNEAIAYYNKVTAINSNDINALYMTGLSYLKSGDKARGEAICNKAIELKPALAAYRQKQEIPM